MAISILSVQDVQVGDTITLTEPLQVSDSLVLMTMAVETTSSYGVFPGIVSLTHTFHNDFAGFWINNMDLSFYYVDYFLGEGNDEVTITNAGDHPDPNSDIVFMRLWHARGIAHGTQDWKSVNDHDHYLDYGSNWVGEECDPTREDLPSPLSIDCQRSGGMIFYMQSIGIGSDCAPEDPWSSVGVGQNNITTLYQDQSVVVGVLDVANSNGIVPNDGIYTMGPASSPDVGVIINYAVSGVMPADQTTGGEEEVEYYRLGQYAAEMRCTEEVDIQTGGSPSISDAQARTGNYSYAMSGGDAVGKDFPEAIAELRCACHFLPYESGITYPLWLNTDSEDETNVTFGIKIDIDNQKIYMIIDGSEQQSVTFAIANFSEEIWAHWAMIYDGTNDRFLVWCNDTKIFDYSAVFTYEEMNRARSGSPIAIGGTEYSDNFYIDQIVSGQPTSRPPYVYYRFGLTDGAGSHSEFTANGDTPNYRCVDDPAAHDGDSTYNISEQGGLTDSFTIEPIETLSSRPGTKPIITAVIPQGIVKADEVSDLFGLTLLLYDGLQTESGLAQVNIDTTYELLWNRFTQQPDTSLFEDLDDVNNMHYGYSSIGAYASNHLSGTLADEPSFGFDPIATASSTGFWEISDGFSISSNNFSHFINTGVEETFTANWLDPTDVTYLNLVSDFVKEINVTALTALVYLYLTTNQLTSLDVSTLSSLQRLYLSFNSITSIDLSGATALDRLSITDNLLTSLDVSANTLLTDLDATDNDIVSVTFPSSSSITDIDLESNQIASIDFTNQVNLDYLSIGDNPFTSLDVSPCTALTYLYVWGYTGITSLDLSSNTLLTYIYLYDQNDLASIDLTGLVNVTTFGLTAPASITSLDLTELTSLDVLELGENSGLQSFDASGTPVTEIYAWETGLTSIDLSGYNLDTCEFEDNLSLTSVNVTGADITQIYLHRCTALTSVDFSTANSLLYLYMDDCSSLTSVDLTGVAVQVVYIRNASLSESAIDNILCQLDATGHSGSYYVYLTGNTPPSATGLICKSSLEGKGWTVSVDVT